MGIDSVLWTGIWCVTLCIDNNVAAENVSAGTESVNLKNQGCGTRPTLVTVGSVAGDYFPMVISLYRCGGTCGRDIPTFRACYPERLEYIYVNAFNKLSLKNETVKFENHTSCSCRCVYNNSVCSETQVWDDKQCRCVCAGTNSISFCPQNYLWNPRYCKCECDLVCTHKQTLNDSSCSCDCRNKYYKRCNRKKKVLRESDCKCYDSSSPSKKDACSTLPTKWAALVIIISICAFVVVAFDCILFCKSTGFVYKSTHLCFQDHHNVELSNESEMPSSDDLDTANYKGIKV